MDWLTNIKTFIDVVDYHSFTKAAEKRYSSPAVLSRRIAWLEDRLGVTLMQRTTRSLQVTAEGKQFYTKGKQLLSHLAEITSHVQNQQQVLKGPLHITMPSTFGETKLVSTLIAKFAAENPLIELTLNFSNQNYDLVENDIDIALRARPYNASGYSSVKIASVNIGVYATTSFLKKNGIPRKLSELSKFNCLLHEHIGYVEWEFKNNKKILVNGNIKSNISHVLINFAKHDLGLVRTLDCYVTSEVKTGILQGVLKNHWPTMDLYLIYKNSPTVPWRVKFFVDYIMSHSLEEYLVLE